MKGWGGVIRGFAVMLVSTVELCYGSIMNVTPTHLQLTATPDN